MAVNTFDISKSHAGQISLSNGDLTATHLVAPWRGIGALYGYSSGKWYWEVTAHKFANEVSSHSIAIGIAISTHTVDSFIGAQDGYSIADDGGDLYGPFFVANTPLGPFGDFEIEETIGVALDLDNGKLFFAREGVWYNSGDPVVGTGFCFSGISGTYFPWISLISAAPSPLSSATINFGVAGPSETIPDGYTMPDYTPPPPEHPGITVQHVIVGGLTTN